MPAIGIASYVRKEWNGSMYMYHAHYASEQNEEDIYIYIYICIHATITTSRLTLPPFAATCEDSNLKEGRKEGRILRKKGRMERKEGY
jgi:hypothetical protein